MLLICLPKITSNFHNTLFLGAAHFARNIPDIHIVLYIHRCMHFKCEQMCFRFVLIFSLGTCWRLATTTHCVVCGWMVCAHAHLYLWVSMHMAVHMQYIDIPCVIIVTMLIYLGYLGTAKISSLCTHGFDSKHMHICISLPCLYLHKYIKNMTVFVCQINLGLSFV